MTEFIRSYAKEMESAYINGSLIIAREVSNYYPPLLGKSDDKIFQERLEANAFHDIAATVHGFKNFSQVRKEIIDQTFETAVNLLLNGDYNGLKSMLQINPRLAKQSSQFGHKAQLLHYCSSNAVEFYRQVVPKNLAKMIGLLLNHGANVDSKIPVYGGLYTFLELFNTSAHPRDAGIVEEINAIFSLE